MDSGLLLKFYGYFLDCLWVLSRTLLRCFWTTFVETAVSVVYNTELNDNLCSDFLDKVHSIGHRISCYYTGQFFL